MQIDAYARDTLKFLLVNNTREELSSLLTQSLIVNNKYIQQPIHYWNQNQLPNVTKSHASGFIINNWMNSTSDSLTAYYNDSALLSLPYLVNVITNLYAKIDNIPPIDASISSFSKPKCGLRSNVNLYVFILLIGFAFTAQTATFAVELVHDREVRI